MLPIELRPAQARSRKVKTWRWRGRVSARFLSTRVSEHYPWAIRSSSRRHGQMEVILLKCLVFNEDMHITYIHAVITSAIVYLDTDLVWHQSLIHCQRYRLNIIARG